LLERRKLEFMRSVPGLRSQLEPRTTALGQEISEGEPILGSTEVRRDPLVDELERIKWFPAHSDYDQDNKKYVDRPLELRKQIAAGLRKVMDSPEYQALDTDETKANYMQKATGIIKKQWDQEHPDDEKAQKRKEKAEASTEERSVLRSILENR